MSDTVGKIELLAPGGDVDCIKAAILGGATAIYCGLDKFNARNRAANISFDDLPGILSLAHANNCEIFITLNIIIVENEITALIALLNKLRNTAIDGVIVQDLGMLYLLSTYFKDLNIHASTQLTTHNEGQILFLSQLGVNRVNLCRELNIEEIKDLTAIGHQNNILTEVFVHGSNCISFSGLCYMSSVHGGNSGNRGRCSQPCRERYLTTSKGKDYPLNLKDNSAFFDLQQLSDAGVASLKIEGRIKKSDYVYTVVNTLNKQLKQLATAKDKKADNSDLYKVFNRDFSNGFLSGNITKDLFIDNPRDHSILHLSEVNTYATSADMEKDQLKLYAEKEAIKTTVEEKIKSLSIAKVPLEISISGDCGSPLTVNIKSPDTAFMVHSEVNLSAKGTEALNQGMVMKRLKAIDDTAYYIEHLELENNVRALYLPFKELTSIKKRILFILNGSKETIAPVKIPALKNQPAAKISPSLSVLISSTQDVSLCNESVADIYFQLPNGIKNKQAELFDLFTQNNTLIPWFPPVIIGEDYHTAVELLQQVKPKCIVTNNTGIAYQASNLDIPWIAGPDLNTANSYSLLGLNEHFNCSGAFISNEISKNQIRNIKAPENFKLFYRIYHPIVLMTSRQCLFHQVTGCEKHKLDEACIQQCDKSACITNLKKETFIIDKSKGFYHTIYNETNFLNTAIVTDLPDHFSSYFIDLRDVKTTTKTEVDKSSLIKLFHEHLNGDPQSTEKLHHTIYPTINTPYTRGF
ncbi:MAG: U32 family peptidase [Marinilabiliaceae bacterium]|nr:U32 family peptidase [Marinilabiliaceae bacterium]